MIKIIGTVIVVAVGTAIGLLKSRSLSLRVKFLEEFLSFITYMETEIRYSSDSLYQIINRFSSTNESSLNFLSYCTEKSHTFSDEWNESIKKISSEVGLKETDIKLIKEFGAGLGISDIDGQIAHCEVNKTHLKSRLSDAIEERNKKGRLYRMLGICSGLTLALILI